MSLKQIFCQEKAISILQRAFAVDRSAHAYIFAGSEGLGKFKTAREWAKLLLCKNPVTENNFADSCGSCRSCELFEAGSHPDFNHIHKQLRQFTKDGKGKVAPVDLQIDVIREFLIAKVSTRPTLSERKVFIVSEAERLNAASQNALLKVLEEPPKYCCIILLCSRLEKLLATTKSRCQIIRFSVIDEERIIDELKEMGLEKKKAQYFARFAQGSIGVACENGRLELAEANLYETAVKLLNSIASYEYGEALELSRWLLEESKRVAGIWSGLDKATSRIDINRRAQKALIRIIISALHDAMKLNIAPTRNPVNFGCKEQIKELAERFDPEQLAEKIGDCYRMLHWIDSNVNEKLIFDQLLLNLAVSDKMRL